MSETYFACMQKKIRWMEGWIHTYTCNKTNIVSVNGGMVDIWAFTIKLFYLFYVQNFSKLNIGENIYWPRETSFLTSIPILKGLLAPPSGTSHQDCTEKGVILIPFSTSRHLHRSGSSDSPSMGRTCLHCHSFPFTL